jgi:hypothetical protein
LPKSLNSLPVLQAEGILAALASLVRFSPRQIPAALPRRYRHREASTARRRRQRSPQRGLMCLC